MKFVFIAHECYPMPIAYHIANEGHEVIFGIVDNYDDLDNGIEAHEKPEEKDQRLSNYDNLIEKCDHKKVLRFLKTVPVNEQDDYFFFFDFNDMHNVAQEILDMGFKNGLFPTEFYYDMEKNRTEAKEFVKKHYIRVKIADTFDFQTIEEGIEHLNESEDIFVLKSNGNVGKTIVPVSDDPEVARKLIIDALETEKKNYEEQGFVLEKKILNCIEVTPVIVFYNGKPIYTLAEFENKEFGAGNIGVQKGGNQNLSIRTNLNAEINKIAFPEIIYDLAMNQPGLAIFDIGLLYDGKDFYFTEFCAMRYGWDGIFAEMVMRDDGKPFVADYFKDIVKGKNPLKNKYGASVRLFNIEGKYEETHEAKDNLLIFWDESIENNLFLYRVKEDDDRMVSVGGLDLIGAATGAGNTVEEAVNKAYDCVEKFHFEKLYYRPKFDFLSKDYKTSILNRVEAMKPFMIDDPKILSKMQAIKSSNLPEKDKNRFLMEAIK